jgi:hypothetical protein
MHISDVHDYSGEEHEVTKQFIEKGRREQIKREIDQLIEDEYDAFEQDANDYISRVAADRAEKFLERLLKGDDGAATALLGSGVYDRHRAQGEPWAELIHGRLFETDAIELRRRIVEAHAELIRSERIADLESIVEGLELQVSKLQRRLDEALERTRR